MGLDMRPLGKPIPGFKKRFVEIFQMVTNDEIPQPSVMDKLLGRKCPTREELLEEWYDIQIPSYETIKAPRVGRDKEADDWALDNYNNLKDKPPF